MIVKSETLPYVEAFHGRPSGPRWLAARREAALKNFGEKGFPTRRQEAWRFTDLRPLQRGAFPPASGVGAGASSEALDAYRFSGRTHRLVLVNGRFAPELSDAGALPQGAWLASTADTLVQRPQLLAAAIDETDTDGNQPFASLNAAFFADGFVLALDPGVTLDLPVEIIHLASVETAQSLTLRNLIALGARSRATLIESFAGEGAYWSNAVSLVRVSEKASLRHVKLQDEGADALHFALTRASLARQRVMTASR